MTEQALVRTLTFISVFIIVIILATCVFNSNYRSIIGNLTKNHIVLRLPKQYMWVGCFGTIVIMMWLIIMSCYPNDTTTVWVYLLFIMFMSAGLVLIIAYRRWRIVFSRDQDTFIYCSILGKVYKFSFSECQLCQRKNNHIRLVVSKKTIYIDAMVTNLDFFLSKLSKFVVIEGL